MEVLLSAYPWRMAVEASTTLGLRRAAFAGACVFFTPSPVGCTFSATLRSCEGAGDTRLQSGHAHTSVAQEKTCTGEACRARRGTLRS